MIAPLAAPWPSLMPNYVPPDEFEFFRFNANREKYVHRPKPTRQVAGLQQAKIIFAQRGLKTVVELPLHPTPTAVISREAAIQLGEENAQILREGRRTKAWAGFYFIVPYEKDCPDYSPRLVFAFKDPADAVWFRLVLG